VIDQYKFNKNGDLLVPIRNSPGEYGIFDIFRRDDEFLGFLEHTGVWPDLDKFSFADELKSACSRVFGIDPALYLTDEGKNTETHIEWKNFVKFVDAATKKKLKDAGRLDSKVTVRELLVYFGTDICRVIDDDCWVRSTWTAITSSPIKLAVIDDCRFKNELYYFKDRGAKVIRLKRKIEESTVKSEIDLDDVADSEFDLVIDNQNMTLEDKNKIVMDWLASIGWINQGIL
jgi:hypothetical protein